MVSRMTDLEDIVGEVARMPVRRGDIAQHVGQHMYLAGQRVLHHLQLRHGR